MEGFSLGKRYVLLSKATIAGEGPTPLFLMRGARSWPSSARDSKAISDSLLTYSPRRITLASYIPRTSSTFKGYSERQMLAEHWSPWDWNESHFQIETWVEEVIGWVPRLRVAQRRFFPAGDGVGLPFELLRRDRSYYHVFPYTFRKYLIDSSDFHTKLWAKSGWEAE